MNSAALQLTGFALREQARAIKERCYAAWHSDPAAAIRCANELAVLVLEHPDSAAAREVEALAQWTAAIADIVAGDLTRAVDRLDRARAAFASLSLHVDAAQTRIPMIMALSMLGRFDEAEACAVAARDALVAQGDLRSAAKVVLNMGSLSYSRDRYAEAAQHYLHASAWFARVGDREHSVLADLGRGDACSFLGDLAEAEALYRRAAQRASAHGLHVIYSSATQALAELAFVRGNYREALTGLEAASRSFAALQLPMLRLQAEKALADTYLELNLFAEAEAIYAQASTTLGDDSAFEAWLHLQRARLAAMQGRDAAATAALQQAQESFDRVDNPVGRAEVSLTRATIAMNSAQWSSACAHAAAALECLETLELPSQHALLALAAAELRQGARASALCRLETLLGDPSTPLPVRERAWLWHGRALLAEGRTDGARASFASAVDLAEVGLRSLPTDDVQRGYLDARAGAFEDLLRLELAAERAEPGDASAMAVFTALERLRARSLLLRLAHASRADTSTDTAETAQACAERERLDWIYRRSNRHLREGTDESPPSGLGLERQALEARILERQRRDRLAAPAQPSAAGDGAPHQARLHVAAAAREALVAYGHLDGEIFAVSRQDGRLRVHRDLVEREELARASHALRLQLETQRLGAVNLARHGELLERRVRHCLGTLYDMLWRPLASALGGVEEVRIVPSAAIGSLPFAALWDGKHYLVERLGICMLASAAATLGSPPRPRVERVLLMADTARLAGSRREVEALAQLWPGARVLGGAALTRKGLQEEAPRADLLHLACHGEFRPDSPLFSALLLGEHAVTALEIEQLPLRQRPIVVLSACDTALSDTSRGDEALGLVRAFLVAGASRVIAGLWQVDDASTADWMTRLHQGIQQFGDSESSGGVSLSRVISLIQRQSINQGVHAYHWAGFTLHGAG